MIFNTPCSDTPVLHQYVSGHTSNTKFPERLTSQPNTIGHNTIIRLCAEVVKSGSCNQVTAFDSSIGEHPMNNPVCSSNYNDAVFTVICKGRYDFNLSVSELKGIKQKHFIGLNCLFVCVCPTVFSTSWRRWQIWSNFRGHSRNKIKIRLYVTIRCCHRKSTWSLNSYRQVNIIRLIMTISLNLKLVEPKFDHRHVVISIDVS